MGIDVNNVYKRFASFTAVNGVSVNIRDGEFFVMLGPSGCGKTTTLRMIAGLELPRPARSVLMVGTSPMRSRATATSPWPFRTTGSIRT